MDEIIKVERVTKAYGALLAVDHVSLSVKRGTAFGLLGANGAGKARLLSASWGQSGRIAGRFLSSPSTPRKTATACFSRWVFNSRSATISQKSRFPNCARKRPVYTRPPPIGEGCVSSLELGTKRDHPSRAYPAGNARGFLSCWPLFQNRRSFFWTN